MIDHKTGTRDEWLAARLELLEAEKELTRRGDELARRRQELPWVRIDKAYRFDTDAGAASLADLFAGRSQLLVYHFMFGPDFTAGCPSCSAIADGFDGSVVHLANHDVTLCAVSRAPLAKLQAYKRRMGWSFPWASSFGSDFNHDFQAEHTQAEQQSGVVEYNFRAIDVRGSLEAGKKNPDLAGIATTASSTTPIRRTRAGSTACGGCTSGSTGRRAGATRPGSGGAATTSTAAADARLARRGRADCRFLRSTGSTGSSEGAAR